MAITINDDPDTCLHTAAGGTLLGTLADNKIFIPSACGGKGTCGVCKVTVRSGGGALLPTETSHVSRGEARDGVRLSVTPTDTFSDLLVATGFNYDREATLEPTLDAIRISKC